MTKYIQSNYKHYYWHRWATTNTNRCCL